MFWQYVKVAIEYSAIPVLGGLAYFPFHKHLYGIYGQEEKLSYSQDNLPFDESTEKVIDELTLHITMRWSPYQVAGIRWFWSNTKDPVVRGSIKTPKGTLIGVPYSFSYQNEADIDNTKIISDYKEILSTDLVNREKLFSSLILSDDAKRFALARELEFISSQYVKVTGFLGFTFLGIGVLSAAGMNSRSKYFNIERTKRSFRVLVYVTLGIGLLNLYQMTLRFYYKDLHLKSDREAANKGKAFAIGGIEYLSKVLKRNQVLRTINGKLGEEMYTPLGDEIPGYFSTSAPVSLRLKYMIGQTRTLYAKEDENIDNIIDSIAKDTFDSSITNN